MSLYLYGGIVAICDRCSMKKFHRDLIKDGNSPGLRVCKSCWDPLNPWRDPPIKPDRVALKWSRPDTPLDAGESYPDYTNPINPVPPIDGGSPGLFEGLEGDAGAVELEDGIGFVELES